MIGALKYIIGKQNYIYSNLKKSNIMLAHKMIAILFSLFLMGISETVCAQTFSSLPESERNAKLIEVAKYVYKNPRWENFYREYGTPEIESFVIEGGGKEKKRKVNIMELT